MFLVALFFIRNNMALESDASRHRIDDSKVIKVMLIYSKRGILHKVVASTVASEIEIFKFCSSICIRSAIIEAFRLVCC